MALFPETLAAAAGGKVVRRARLVTLDFTTGTRRLFTGTGKLRASDGEIYEGMQLGSIGNIQSEMGGLDVSVEFVLSGVDPGVISAATNKSVYVGRSVKVFWQGFDEDWNLLDQMRCTYSGMMDSLEIECESARKRRVTLVSSGRFSQRGYAPFGYLSDRDQKRLHPGDRGCELVASMASKTVRWPLAT